ncbi:MAG: MASE1 domain-containing protein [Methylomonas sp.]|jgi:integral membrane sensor domain MASE1|uniref:MASE1 domain-containing protein n=1 Tax=Methylomonas sp. TaxID=418 RepID=UPI00341CAC99|nr:MASE1 domain-containing protein [Methylomonas sp.]
MAYVTSAYLMAIPSIINHHGTVIWMPNGVALAIMLISGRQTWPGIIIGSLAAGLVLEPLSIAVSIAFANALEVYCASGLIKTYNRDFDSDSLSTSDFITLFVVTPLTSCISALFGSFAQGYLGLLGTDKLLVNVFHWWQADILGIVVCTPFVLVWRHLPSGWFNRTKRIFETLIYILLSFIVSMMLFLDLFKETFGELSRGYWVFLLILWGAFRFGCHGGNTAFNDGRRHWLSG